MVLGLRKKEWLSKLNVLRVKRYQEIHGMLLAAANPAQPKNGQLYQYTEQT
jgi:hypothetical protein